MLSVHFATVSPSQSLLSLRWPSASEQTPPFFNTEQSPKVAIVNQRFVEQFFAGKNALGKNSRTVSEPNYPEAEYQIIGVIKNTRYGDLRGQMPPIAYAPDFRRG
jgi:hypothetical protein